jgi:hypothetical protein
VNVVNNPNPVGAILYVVLGIAFGAVAVIARVRAKRSLTPREWSRLGSWVELGFILSLAVVGGGLTLYYHFFH